MSTAQDEHSSVTPPDRFDRDYWLAHCEGFRVDTADGRLGVVQEVRAGGGPEDAVLAVRVGVFGRRVVLVPVRAVDFIVPRAERIWLHSPPEIVGSEPAPPPG